MGNDREYLDVVRPAITGLRWGHPFRYVTRALESRLAEVMPRAVRGREDRVLDFGCASSPYRHLLPNGCRYYAADLPGNPAAEIEVQPDGRLPCDGNGFDAVLSTQVLEHVVDPRTYLAECFRVLRPGGRLLLSTHGTMMLHRDPTDYWRWTSDGLRRTVEREGFCIAELHGVLGMASTALQLFTLVTYQRFPRGTRRLYCRLMEAIVAFFDRIDSAADKKEDAMVFVLIAEKPHDTTNALKDVPG